MKNEVSREEIKARIDAAVHKLKKALKTLSTIRMKSIAELIIPFWHISIVHCSKMIPPSGYGQQKCLEAF
jgi:hypothetical protein